MDSASHIVLFSGAGISAESGVPTFRGPGGLWKNYRPEQLATPQAFAADARLVWEWYGWRRQLVSACSPNAGHEAVARAQNRAEGAFTVVTQNVDGLHERALLDLEDGPRASRSTILEMHGSLFRLRCTHCTYTRSDRDAIDASTFATLPRCPECDALLRPGVVWFGESLDPDVLQDSFNAAARADLCIVVGTSAVVEPAASLPRQTAASGGRVIEVNVEDTPLSRSVDMTLRGSAGLVLPELLAGQA